MALAHQEPGQPPAPAVAALEASGRITLDVVANDKSGTPARKILWFEAKVGREPVEITLVLDAVTSSFSRVAYERAQLRKFLQQDGGKLAQPVSIAFFTDAGLTMQQAGSRDGNALAAFVDQSEYGLRSIRRLEGFYGAAERSQLSIRTVAPRML